MDPVPDVVLVEDWAEKAAQHLGPEVQLAVLRPWSAGEAPAGVLAPSRETGSLDTEVLARALEGKRVLLVGCTFETTAEQEAANVVLQQFSPWENMCVLMAMLLQPNQELSQEVNDAIMRRYEMMLATGVDEVIMDPKPDTTSLRQVLSLSQAVWDVNVRRVELLLASEPHFTQADVDTLRARHQRLFWESIPRAVMPHFAALDRNLPEKGYTLGGFRLVRRLDAVTDNVLLAVDEQHENRVIKVIDKEKVTSTGELESIYRELRFLSEIIQHPNVVQCVGMMHSTKRIYMVFHYAGNQNLSQYLATCPGERLDEPLALHCFRQVLSGLAHCHSRGVVHRRVCLRHVVANRHPREEGFDCQLVDFRSATAAVGDTMSQVLCGGLPCIAPEVALGRLYLPRLADCWSLGVLLLEVAGGKGSLVHSLRHDPERAERAAVAEAVLVYFAQQGSHARALGCMGAVESEAVCGRLERLLQPQPAQRAELQELVAEG